LMNKQETGLASSSLTYRSLQAILDHWDVHFGETGEDRFGPFVRVHRGPQKERVIDGCEPEPVRQLAGPIHGRQACAPGNHCAAHGPGPFNCCRCGCVFEQVALRWPT